MSLFESMPLSEIRILSVSILLANLIALLMSTVKSFKFLLFIPIKLELNFMASFISFSLCTSIIASRPRDMATFSILFAKSKSIIDKIISMQSAPEINASYT